MATYSPTVASLFDRLYRAHLQAEGPPAGRTRSQTGARAATKTPGLNPGSTKVTKPRRRNQPAAARRLCAKRLQLKKRLERDEEYRDDSGVHLTTTDIRRRVRQLSCEARSGTLDQLPRPHPRTVRSLEDIAAARRKKLAGPSSLPTMERALSPEDEIEEWGLLPGEVRDDEPDFEMEQDLLDLLMVDEENLEALADGEQAVGVWRRLLAAGSGSDTERDMVRRAGEEAAWRRRAQEGAVMDGRCVAIVKDVWRFA
ncbi:hypothetical protein N0V83_010670 [Neocucurbitaria cava]|uniref:Uncharacterized protein n=1 Tax=Neocucurbitaria cava TaxID=798079 RepID=A0A9W8XYS0_9PLEO|nr:hypothetical protein N0V83_010670 [Neocucurbitaria cava]